MSCLTTRKSEKKEELSAWAASTECAHNEHVLDISSALQSALRQTGEISSRGQAHEPVNWHNPRTETSTNGHTPPQNGNLVIRQAGIHEHRSCMIAFDVERRFASVSEAELRNGKGSGLPKVLATLCG